MNMPKHPRVLYVENNEDAFYMVKVLLGMSNIDVIVAKTLAEAWQFAKSEHFDLYMLDSRLPDGSGFDLCRDLRQFAPYTPILFYSASAFETDKQMGLNAGANAYLTKPYIHDLVETVLLSIKLSKKPIANSYHDSLLETNKRDDFQNSQLHLIN